MDQQPAARERLLELLHRHGILYASPTQPVLSRDGSSAQWMLDSLSVSLGPEGLELAGQCLLALLERFEGRQVATYGVTAIPLLSSCILQSKGRYRGLLVRKERKKHGSLKRIEGRIDPDEPVVMLDDSVSSGTTMEACRKRLEEAGLWVEGGISLVRFGWYSGFALMQERGYRMEAVYDIYQDFIYRMEGERDAVPNPTKVFPEHEWSEEPAPEGLHPATLARRMIESVLESGRLPRPPRSFDQPYDSAGGTWVSVRSRENIYLRHARDGLWHFPEEEAGPPGRDLAMAALRTAHKLPRGEAGLQTLATSSIAVTFFSRLDPCTVGELDNDRYGVVVRSRERPSRMGGALPRMPGIKSAWQQFQHARRRNADLVSFEPYALFRHDVVKVVEPGAAWQPTGVPKATRLAWHEDPEVAGRIARVARGRVLEALGHDPGVTLTLPEEIPPADLDSIYVTVYFEGRLRGCMGIAVGQIDEDLGRLARLAVRDPRFVGGADKGAEQVAVTVSLLYNRLDLGTFSPAEAAERSRHGQQALMVHQGKRSGLLLPFVVATDDLSPEAYVAEVIDKAGITRPPYSWRRFDCATWLADGTAEPRPLLGALPLAPEPESGEPFDRRLARLAELLSAYLLRHQSEDGRLYFRYLPHKDVLYQGGDLPRIAHGAWILGRAGCRLDDPALRRASGGVLAYLRPFLTQDDEGCSWLVRGPEDASSVAELSFLLLALLSGDTVAEEELAERVAATLWSRFGTHGRIATHREPRESDDAFQHYFPGQVLLALAEACQQGVSAVDEDPLRRAFRFYRHRFFHRRHFGQVSWQMSAFAAWFRVLEEPEFARFVFDIADWLIEHQEEKSGGFLTDHQSDAPGYTTAVYLEGLGAAYHLAVALGENRREAPYRRALERGFAFVDRLVLKESMAPLLPNPPWAIGGVRTSLYRDEVRIDFVQHALNAVLELMCPP